MVVGGGGADGTWGWGVGRGLGLLDLPPAASLWLGGWGGPSAPGEGMNGGGKAAVRRKPIGQVMLVPAYLVPRLAVPGADRVGLCDSLL